MIGDTSQVLYLTLYIDAYDFFVSNELGLEVIE